MTELIKIVKLNDLHVPFEDRKAVRVAFEFCKKMQPEIIICDEWHDFYSISRFNKDPARKLQLQDELDSVNIYFKILREHCPNSRIIYLDSNHNKRLRKYLWSTAEELSSLRCLRLGELLNLKKYNIEYKDYFIYNNFMFKHGDLIRKWSGYTARGEFEKEGMSGASGHSHRLSQFYISLRGGEYSWVECGMLCRTDQEYLENSSPNWQLGIGLVIFWGTHYRAMPLPIIDYNIHWL